MKRKEAEQFILDIYGENDICLLYIWWQNHFPQIEACTTSFRELPGRERKIIVLNRNLWSKFTDVEQRSILLHEVGHVVYFWEDNYARAEYLAHKWAMKTAKRLKMSKELKYLKDVIQEWHLGDWTTDDRRYIMAAKMLDQDI